MLTPTGGLVVLAVWPLICAYLILSMPLVRGILWSIFGGFMLLPVGIAIDPPLLPSLDKVAAPSLGVFLTLLFMGRKPHQPRIESKLILFLLVIMLVQPVFTVLTNSERSFSGSVAKTGLTLYDAISSSMRHYILVIPFLIGYRFIGSKQGHKHFIQVILTSGLAYSLLMLIELRLSPQMHSWVYGYFQHTWIQMLRDGGYRPILFLPHALWVAFFTMTALVSAIIMSRTVKKKSNFNPYIIAAIYLFVVLVLCKSMGSLIFSVFLIPIILFTSSRFQIQIAALLALIAMLYPALRSTDLIPVRNVVELISVISPDRATSLEFRLDNEDRLLARANEKPLFGWGGRGRNLVYNENGEKITVIDGYWVIVIGQHGWFGYISQFGLLGMPVLALFRRMRRGLDPGPVTSGLALLLAVNMIELLPNATLMPWTWMLAGALLGFVDNTRREQDPLAGEAARAAMCVPRRRTIL